jgi:NADH-quinone oxidoreductase subunit G
MCYYSSLKESGGKCRVCLVKVAQGSAKDPRPMPKLVASCMTQVQDGMVVQNTTSPDVLDARKGIVELLLINHPLDCPICDQAGECDLQDLAFAHGNEKTRSEEQRRTFNKIDIGPNIQLHMTRCILCYRCVQVADQLTDKRVHGVINRSDSTEISTYIKNAVDNEFSGNMIDVCPVGALTDKKFRFKDRVWFIKPMDAHRSCSKCSGKVVIWLHGEEIRRITGRKDEFGEVKEFICNECRFDKRNFSDWVIEGPRTIKHGSVISQNHYVKI